MELRHNDSMDPARRKPEDGAPADRDAWFGALVGSAADAIVGFDHEGRVVSWNAAAERLLGHPAAEALGMTWQRLLPPGHLLSPGQRIAHRMHRDGRLLELLVSTSPILDADGLQIGLSEVMRPMPPRGDLPDAEPRLAKDLREGLARGEVGVLYQPIYRLADGSVHSAEALARWDHPELGPVPPDVFIAVAEHSGVILELGRFVMQTACRQLGAWDAAGAPAIALSVNVSAVQLKRGDLAGELLAAASGSGIDPRRITLEITETAFVDDGEATVRGRLEQLRRIGVRLAIDDFGVGYSSLSRLRDYRVDQLKIDRSFIRDIVADATAREVVATIIALAHKLGIEVVAEGIESEAQRALLQQQGCDFGQGFLMSRPVDAATLIERL